MDVDESALSEITRAVWETTVGRNIDGPLEVDEPPLVWTAVDIHGTWTGTLVVGVPERLAKAVAGSMLGVPDADATLSDGREAMAEIANQIGGNLKGILPGKNQLSLPRPALSDEVSHAKRQWFDCEGSAFAVGVLPKAA